MERLTYRDKYGMAMMKERGGWKSGGIDRLAAYEDTGLEPQDIISAVDMAKIACALHELNAYKDIGPIEHLRDLIQAEQDGRLVVLPCKVGAPVYTTHWWKDVKEKCTDSHGKPFYRMMSKKIIKKERFDPFGLHYELLGKTVFLTREEAEAALKGGEG